MPASVGVKVVRVMFVPVVVQPPRDTMHAAVATRKNLELCGAAGASERRDSTILWSGKVVFMF
jgi:hypothetical protein